MIILSKLADYGVIVATALAGIAPDKANAPHLAEQTRLPPATVAKVLKLLARGGVVTASRGAGGGYSLARDAGAVSIAEIVASIDGDLAMTACSSHGPHDAGTCERDTFCATRPHWARINLAVDSALRGISLREMLPGRQTESAAQRLFAPFLPQASTSKPETKSLESLS
jgi:FeS assembly SUF system regulator